MVDYIADYLENIRDRRVFPDVKPGYMRELVNDTAPTDGEDWDCIFKDVERVIMPGVSFIFFYFTCIFQKLIIASILSNFLTMKSFLIGYPLAKSLYACIFSSS